MKAETRQCPICKENVTSFTYNAELISFNAALTTIRSVPSVTYACEEHGWFSLSKEVNDLVISSEDPSVKQKLAAIVKERYVPEQDQPLALKPIESLA